MAKELAEEKPSVSLPMLVLPGTASAGLENARRTTLEVEVAMAGAATGGCWARSTEVWMMMTPAFCALPIVTERAGNVRVCAAGLRTAAAVTHVTVAYGLYKLLRMLEVAQPAVAGVVTRVRVKVVSVLTDLNMLVWGSVSVSTPPANDVNLALPEAVSMQLAEQVATAAASTTNPPTSGTFNCVKPVVNDGMKLMVNVVCVLRVVAAVDMVVGRFLDRELWVTEQEAVVPKEPTFTLFAAST